ncbi:hypothetical protein QL285_089730 [Trifolium repens]|nr:hypothetical protein QL285_089730 [Trifolium repens]
MQSEESIGRSAINKKKCNAIRKINRKKCNQLEEIQRKKCNAIKKINREKCNQLEGRRNQREESNQSKSTIKHRNTKLQPPKFNKEPILTISR